MTRWGAACAAVLLSFGLAYADSPTTIRNLNRACTKPECQWLNDNFTILDVAAGTNQANTWSGQQRVLAAIGGTAGGITVDASGLTGGIGMLVENNRGGTFVANDPAYPFWIGADGDGTAAVDGAITSMGMEVHDNTPGDDGVFAFRRSRGTHATPTVVQAGDIIGTITGQGWDGQAGAAGWTNSTQGGVVAIEFYAAETYSATAHGSAMKLFTIPIGSSTLNAVAAFSPAGTATFDAVRIDGDADSGQDATARLQVIEPLGSGITIQKLQTTTTADDPTENTMQCRAATTGNTPTGICSVAVASGTVILVDMNVVAHCTGGVSCPSADGGAGYKVVGTCKNIGGTTAAVTGSPDVVATGADATMGTATLTCDDTSDTAIITVTGVATTNITWHATVRSMALGS